MPDREAGTLLAVDGNSVAHRAYYAYERMGLAAPDGRPIFAVYGFLALLAGICDRVNPDALVVGFDDRAGSVRRDIYPEYKAGRAERSPDLYAQMDEIVDVLRALGVVVVMPEGWEADDVVGSAAKAAERAGWRCVVATSDKDAFALITEWTSVLWLRDGLNNAVRMTPQLLHEKYGVWPGQYLDYAALVGDKSDHLRGVEGIGEKTAVKLLAAVGSVDAALLKANREALIDAVGPAYAARLRTEEARAAFDRNIALMTIQRDVPIDVAACQLATTPGTVTSVLRERHLPSLIRRTTVALCRPEPPRPAPRQRGQEAAALDQHPADDRSAPPLVRADPAPVCPDCGQECAASLPLAQLDADRRAVLTGEQVLVDGEAPLGDLLAVPVGDVWAVRRLAGEYGLRPENRRRAHYCLVYAYTCPIPKCGKPARMYAAGPRCNDHVPSTPPPIHAASRDVARSGPAEPEPDPDAVMIQAVLQASRQPMTTELLVSAANAYGALRSSRERQNEGVSR